ncbi:EAL domain-containing protein [Ramlibacter sp. H39-3-26]|nr:EAL domain-containing protein [Ramlibacter sp. H39-3-26]
MAQAEAMRLALARKSSVGRVEVAATAAQARALLPALQPDAAVVAFRLADGTVFDLQGALGAVPAIVAVPAGDEGVAAQALHAGFADYVIQDASLGYLQVLPAQVDAAYERACIRLLGQKAEYALLRQHRLLQAVSSAQAAFIGSSGDPHAPFRTLLEHLLDLTGSVSGFMVAVPGPEGAAVRVEALAGVAGGPGSWPAAEGADYQPMPDTPCGQALHSGLPQVSGAQCMQLALPIVLAGQPCAVVVLAGNPQGYGAEDIEFLQPLQAFLAQLVQARRTDAERLRVQRQLRETSELLAQKSGALELTLESMTQGITNVDAEGRIRVYNRRYLELLNLPESLLTTQPWAEEVMRLQTERGDFGPGFERIELPARDYVVDAYAAHGNKMCMPDAYLRRTLAGRMLEVRTRMLPTGGRVRTFTDVTDYIEAQEALRQNEARWRSLTSLSADWYWEQDECFRFVRFDGMIQRLPNGLAEGRYLGRACWELQDVRGITPEQWRIHQAQLAAHEVFSDFEMQHVAPDGSARWVSMSGEPIYDAAGHFTGYRGVGRDITERKKAEAQIQRLAFYDELTGLPNRRLLLDRLVQAVASSARRQRHGALLFLDLDNFKDLNDTLGHDWGDKLLVQVAARIGHCVRVTDTVSRLGGDEFIVLLEGLHAIEPEAAAEAEAVAQKMLAALNQVYLVDGNELYSTPSIGITLFRDAAMPVDELLKRADLAMYQAKAAGRNTLCFFDPRMQATVSARSALESDMRQGLQRSEFLLHYQPVVDVDARILGVEALVRWNHPMRGMVSPAQFIPLAEQSGLILQLGQQVLRAACAQVVAWSANPATAQLTMAVNVSAREFRHPDFVQNVLAAIESTGANPQRLKLEITESMLLTEVEDIIAKMNALRTRGIGFSLDDFGTGYSSLAYLKRLPLDQLKIDQSFVRDVLADPNDAVIARTIVALAHSLGLDVVAEGVETEGQRVFLVDNGCHRFQGYLFGRPVPVEQLAI